MYNLYAIYILVFKLTAFQYTWYSVDGADKYIYVHQSIMNLKTKKMKQWSKKLNFPLKLAAFKALFSKLHFV